MSSQDVVLNIASFFNDIGYSSHAHALLKSEIRDITPRILNVLTKNEVYLIFDSLDKASIDVVTLLGKIFKESVDYQLTGGIILSSIDSIGYYSQIDVLTNKVIEYPLFGFSLEDTVLFFEENNIKISIEDTFDFHKAVGGYPISFVFFKQLISSGSLSSEDVDLLKELSIDTARKWLFEKVFSTLKQEEKDVVLNVSLFNYPFNEKEAEQVINAACKPKYLFDSLINKNIILSSRNSYHLHDSIRTLLYDMLATEIKINLHNKIAKYYREVMEHSFGESNEVLYEDIFKWGYHLEQLKEGENLSEICVELLQLDEDDLDALWAIERFGFPFSFSDPDLELANSSVDFLLEKGLVKKNFDDTKRYFHTMKENVLEGFEFFDSCFLHHLCITRGISNHLGYIETFEPNYSFDIQGIICAWEHCIEYMPLPPMTKAEHEKRIEFLQDQFDKHAYDDKPSDIRERLWNELQEGVPDDAPEYPDLELEAASCPIFGHCCPDGKEQASYCRELENDEVEDL